MRLTQNSPRTLLAAGLAVVAVTARTQTVTATVNEVTWQLSNNAVTVGFGYFNSTGAEINVPLGAQNFFTPSPPFRGQPTFFPAGSYPSVFTVTFPYSSYVQWNLQGALTLVDKTDITRVVSQGDTSFSTTVTMPNLAVTGGGTLTLTGNPVLTVTSGITLENAGTLRVEGVTLDTPGISASGASATLQFAHGGTESSPWYFTRDGTASGAAVTLTGAALLRQTSGYTVLGGSLAHTGGTVIEDGTLNLGTADQTFDSLAGVGGTVVLGTVGGRTLTISGTTDTTFAGTIGGVGALAKTGFSTLTLTGDNPYSGGTHLAAGTLLIGSDTALGTGTIILNGGTIGTTGGPRTLANSATLQADTTLTGSDDLTLNGRLTLARSRELTVDSGLTFTLAGGIDETGAARSLAKYGAGTLVITGAGTYRGGTLLAEGTTTINNSTGSAFGTGAVTVAAGATLTGAGGFTGALQLNGTFSPGNSPGITNTGNATWSEGAGYIWEINDALGTVGTNWDLINISGTLTLAATAQNPFTIALTSLTSGNQGGALLNFDPTRDHVYRIATASGGITSFSASLFALNTAGFVNSLEGGTWTIAQNGNDLNLVFTAAIPEPSAFAALAGSLTLGLAATRRRRRR